MRRLLGYLMLAGLAGAAPTAAIAETVIPATVAYQVAENATVDARVCQLVLDATDPDGAELVRFAAVVAYDAEEQAFMAGLRLGVADLTATADAADLGMVELMSAGFSAPGFNTAGLYQEMDEDNSVWTWAPDDESAGDFLEAYLAGHFELVFWRADPASDLRRYQIVDAPGKDVAEQFLGCLKRLAPEAVVGSISAASLPVAFPSQRNRRLIRTLHLPR